MDNTQEPKTPEEIAELRAKMSEYYKVQNPVILQQVVYETAAADIEDARLRRLKASIAMAELTSSIKESEEPKK